MGFLTDGVVMKTAVWFTLICCFLRKGNIQLSSACDMGRSSINPATLSTYSELFTWHRKNNIVTNRKKKRGNFNVQSDWIFEHNSKKEITLNHWGSYTVIKKIYFFGFPQMYRLDGSLNINRNYIVTSVLYWIFFSNFFLFDFHSLQETCKPMSFNAGSFYGSGTVLR